MSEIIGVLVVLLLLVCVWNKVKKSRKTFKRLIQKYIAPNMILRNSNVIQYDQFNPMELMQPEIVFYFSGGLDSAYHITQWTPYLKQLPYKVLLVTRSSKVISALKGIDIPIVYIKKMQDLDMIPKSVKVAFYANNSANNTHFIRRLDIEHVLLLHGESDKISSVSNVSRMYDKLFVAGQAAIDRYANAGVEIDKDTFEIIGRPQVDTILTKNIDQDYKTILYAPTWEGYFDDSTYSSLLWAKQIIEKILEYDRTIRIIFRPHPLTGNVNVEYKEKIEEIETLLDISQQHIISGPFGVDQSIVDDFNMSDILLTDISAVLADFLQSEKPCIVSDVANIGVKVMHETNMTTKGSYILNVRSLNIKEILDSIFKQKDPLKEERIQNKKYILGDFEGLASDKFREKIDKIYHHSVDSKMNSK